MPVFFNLSTCFCCFRKKTQTQEAIENENNENDGLKNKESDDLSNKESLESKNPNPDSDEEKNVKLPLPPAALRGTYSCKNLVLENSRSIRKKLMSASLKIQMPRASSLVHKRDHHGEEKKIKKIKEENSILVKPIILGEKCRVLDEEGERMPKNRMYRPRSMSSISLSLANAKSDENVNPDTETSKEIQLEKKENDDSN